MLVITRSEGQKLVIQVPTMPPTEVEIEVTRISGNRCRLGIDADDSVTIMRSEVLGGDGEAEPVDGAPRGGRKLGRRKAAGRPAGGPR